MSSFEPVTTWDEPGDAATDVRYAGFWIRVVAFILDLIIFSLPLTLLLVLIGEYGTSTGALLQTLAGAAYFIVGWTRFGRTIGGAIVGLRLIRVDGQPVTYGTAAIRYLMVFVSFVALFIGVVWVAFNARKQGWMDIVAGTYVIHD